MDRSQDCCKIYLAIDILPVHRKIEVIKSRSNGD